MINCDTILKTILDFNFAQEYRIVNDSIKLQDNLIKSDFYLYKQKSPRRDLTQLTVILKKFLGKSWFGHPLTPQWVIDVSNGFFLSF